MESTSPFDFTQAAFDALGGDLFTSLVDDIKRGWSAKLVLARSRQARIAAFNQQLDHATIDGIGECVMDVDVEVYHAWGQMLGYECWDDEEFCREFRRDNPEVRVKARSHKPSILVT